MIMPSVAANELNVNWLVEPIFDNAFYFSEGLASVRVGDKWGFIDITGEMVIPPTFDMAWQFSEGLAHVRKDGEIGFIDKTGTMVFTISEEYNFAGLRFSDGMVWVLKGDIWSGKWGFVDREGNVIVEPIYDSVSPINPNVPSSLFGMIGFSEGLAAVQLGDYWGFVNTTGEVAIPIEFDRVGHFSEGLAFVEKGDKQGYINKMGEFVILFENAFIGSPFSEGLAAVWTEERYGYIDKTGEFVIELPVDEGWYPFFWPLYTHLGEFRDGVARLSKDQWHSQTNFIDKGGNTFLLDRATIGEFSQGLIREREWRGGGIGGWGVVGFINIEGETIIPHIFDEARDFSEGFSAVRMGDKWGFIKHSDMVIEDNSIVVVVDRDISDDNVVIVTFFVDGVLYTVPVTIPIPQIATDVRINIWSGFRNMRSLMPSILID